MKLIVGLGNPGEKYARSRHNLGFLVLEQLAKRLTSNTKSDLANTKWLVDAKTKALVAKLSALEVILAKPQTFVNQTGTAVRKIVKFFKIAPNDILVIRDDIDLPEGKIRGPKDQTGSGGHLGTESIIENLGSNNFYQLKIGVGRPKNKIDPADFVLQKVTDYQWENFENLIEKEVIVKIQNWIDG